MNANQLFEDTFNNAKKLVAQDVTTAQLPKSRMIKNMNETKEIRRHWFNLGFAACVSGINKAKESNDKK